MDIIISITNYLTTKDIDKLSINRLNYYEEYRLIYLRGNIYYVNYIEKILNKKEVEYHKNYKNINISGESYKLLKNFKNKIFHRLGIEFTTIHDLSDYSTLHLQLNNIKIGNGRVYYDSIRYPKNIRYLIIKNSLPINIPNIESLIVIEEPYNNIYDKIHILSDKVFGTNLRFLQIITNISTNMLLPDHKQFIFNKSFIDLQLRTVLIHKLPLLTIHNLPRTLMKLKLSYCFLKKIENLPENLIELDLSYNEIQVLENLPTSLTKIIINNNRIRVIENLNENENLEVIVIKHNFIENLKNLENLPGSLKLLDIYNNKLEGTTEKLHKIIHKNLLILMGNNNIINSFGIIVNRFQKY